jgi:hypothetical protein
MTPSCAPDVLRGFHVDGLLLDEHADMASDGSCSTSDSVEKLSAGRAEL